MISIYKLNKIPSGFIINLLISHLALFTCIVIQIIQRIGFLLHDFLLFYIALFLLVEAGIIIFSHHREIVTFKDFGADTVGLENDSMMMSPYASHYAKVISNSTDYVSVYAVLGDYGTGKSSFARMIVESLDKSSALYTYISLTETDEKDDFNRLFQQRWVDSVMERYPVSRILNMNNLLEIIFRSKYKININFYKISRILGLNNSLFKIELPYYDGRASKLPINSKIEKLFFHIPRFREKLWIVLIDEFERGKLNEIYNCIEIIERYKHICRTGTPIKIAFLLTVSNKQLEQILSNVHTFDYTTNILIDYIHHGLIKSTNERIFVPKPPEYILDEYINNKIEEIKVICRK